MASEEYDTVLAELLASMTLVDFGLHHPDKLPPRPALASFIKPVVVTSKSTTRATNSRITDSRTTAMLTAATTIATIRTGTTLISAPDDASTAIGSASVGATTTTATVITNDISNGCRICARLIIVCKGSRDGSYDREGVDRVKRLHQAHLARGGLGDWQNGAMRMWDGENREGMEWVDEDSEEEDKGGEEGALWVGGKEMEEGA